MRLGKRCIAVALAVSLASCGGGAPQVIQTANLSTLRLQFSVGTLNFIPLNANGDQLGAPVLNLVETFRQPSGATGLLNSVVSVTGPPSFVAKNIFTNQGIPFDGGAQNQVIDTLQQLIAGGEGLAQLVNGVSSAPLIGGPPAFPRTTDGNYPAGFSYGIDIQTIGGSQQSFPNGFPLGTYVLKVATPPGSPLSNSWTASAQLSSMTTLPSLVTPVISFDGKGGGAVSLVVPAKLTELFIGISASSNFCWPQGAPVSSTVAENASSGLFSFFIKAPVPGPLTIAIPDSLGPPTIGGNAPTFCSAAQNLKAFPDDVAGTGAGTTVTILGADYPLYEMSYPQSSSQLPPIAGTVDPDGKPLPQSDITESTPTTGTAP